VRLFYVSDIMRYYIAFSRLQNDKLRELLVGNEAKNIEPLTGVTYLQQWIWNAIRNVAREEGKPMAKVLNDACREYVLKRGYRRPHQNIDDEKEYDLKGSFFGRLVCRR